MAVIIDFHDYSNTNDPVWPKQEEVGLFLVLFNTYFAQSMKLDKFVDSGAMAYFYKGVWGNPQNCKWKQIGRNCRKNNFYQIKAILSYNTNGWYSIMNYTMQWIIHNYISSYKRPNEGGTEKTSREHKRRCGQKRAGGQNLLNSIDNLLKFEHNLQT